MMYIKESFLSSKGYADTLQNLEDSKKMCICDTDVL